MKIKGNKKFFSEFTNLYELSKTLRFELKPIGKTKQLLEEQKVIKKDKRILDNYNIIKKYFDKLHKKFIRESLKDVDFDYTNYKIAFLKYSKNKNDSNKREAEIFRKEEDKLRAQIKNLFDDCAKKWKVKYNHKGAKIKSDKLDILFKKEILDVLKMEYTVDKNDDVEYIDEDGNKINIFDSFKGFSTYFTNFHNSRKNFYEIKNAPASAVPTRIINDNLRKFIENYEMYKHAEHKIQFNDNEKEIFKLNYYNNCFLQDGIDKYNKIIGDINSKINKYRQDNKEKMPFLKILFKQILEDVGKQETEQSDFIEIESDERVFEVLIQFIEHNEVTNKKFQKIFNNFINRNDFDLDKIYLAGRFVNQISNKWFKGWELFGKLLVKKGEKKVDDFIPFSEIKEVLQKIETKNEDLFKEEVYKHYKDKNLDAFQVFMSIWEHEFNACLEKYNKTLKIVNEMITKDKKYSNKKEKRSGEEVEVQKEKIKEYADSALSIYQMMKYFLLEKGKEKINLETENNFYNEYNIAIEENKTWLYYNEFRNYLTKKPFNQDKIKLNFENGTLLDGWDKNKESSNYGIILRKDAKYYLGVMLPKHNNLFKDKNLQKIVQNNDSKFYEKMVYKFLPDPKKMLPKVCFSKKGKYFFKPKDEILKIKEKEEFKSNTNYFSLDSLHKIIDYYKNCLNKYEDWSCFDFSNLKDTKEYATNIGEFYKDIEKKSWKIWFEKIPEKYIDENVKNGKLYLFEIYNKDFSEKSNGKFKNLHTIYFKNIFSKENIENPVVKLNGQAEIFFREKSIKKEIKEHKKNHDIIKNNRYTEDKLFFHCPIKLNFAKSDNKVNLKVNELITDLNNLNIIGIDRGEKHLAYYSVIDKDGKIIEIDTLNKVNGINYLNLLDEKEKKINKQQKSWQAIENIKELKEGYISHVIKKICDLAIEHNAIIVFEDLNSGFKRGRQKIKKQIYQKLELALVNKLNYLVYKNEDDSNKAGHYFRAYQLTPKIDNFKDIGKQSGIVFYTQAGYTSTTCPKCGFRKNLYIKYSNKEKANKLFINMQVFYDKEKKSVAIKYNPANFQKFNFPKDEYIFYINGERLKWNNNERKVEKIDLNEKIVELLKRNNIKLSQNISNQILNSKLSSRFFKEFILYMNMALQLRNSDSENNIDYLLCPSCGFHSKDGLQGQKYNADANGAYNIARKGMMIIDKIKRFKDEKGDISKLKWGDLIVRNEEWDNFVQR